MVRAFRRSWCHIAARPALQVMFKMLRIACVLAFFAAAPACLDTGSEDDPIESEEEQDLGLLAPPSAPSCESTCMSSTSTCTTACTAPTGQQTTCAANEGSCMQLLERKAREGRNPQTGETIQIPAKTTLK